MAYDLILGHRDSNHARGTSSTVIAGDFEEQLVARVRAKVKNGVEPTMEECQEVNRLARLGDPNSAKLVAEWKTANPLAPKARFFLIGGGILFAGLAALLLSERSRRN